MIPRDNKRSKLKRLQFSQLFFTMNYHANNSTPENMPSQQSGTGNFGRKEIILVSMSAIIIAINLLIIVAFLVRSKLRRHAPNVLIFSMACSDLLNGVVFVPVILTTNAETLGYFSCYILFLSLFNLLALSIDRYLALYKPLLHYRIMNLKKTINVIVTIWIIPLILTLIPITWKSKSNEFKEKAKRNYLAVVWCFMLILVIIMSVLYSLVTYKAKITIRSKRHSVRERSHDKIANLARKELRVIHLFGLLLLFFSATYIPILYMNLCDLIGISVPAVLEIVGLYLLFLNSMINPVLCIYLKKDFYQNIRHLILCCKINDDRWRFNQSTMNSRSEFEISLMRRTATTLRKISSSSRNENNINNV